MRIILNRIERMPWITSMIIAIDLKVLPNGWKDRLPNIFSTILGWCRRQILGLVIPTELDTSPRWFDITTWVYRERLGSNTQQLLLKPPVSNIKKLPGKLYTPVAFFCASARNSKDILYGRHAHDLYSLLFVRRNYDILAAVFTDALKYMHDDFGLV
jgi:hypothetical protein